MIDEYLTSSQDDLIYLTRKFVHVLKMTLTKYYSKY